MFRDLEIPDARSTTIARLKSREPDTNADEPIGRELLGPVAKLIWPKNTAAVLADIAQADVRTAERWLSGLVEAPPPIFAAILERLVRRRRRHKARKS
jgi:hypothetical protein